MEDVAIKKCKEEITEDEGMDNKDVVNPSDNETEEQHQPLKIRINTKNFNKGMSRSLESKQVRKDFSKHPYWRNRPLWKCQSCPFKSHFLAGYKRHIMMHDKNKERGKDQLCCGNCKECFKDQATYNAHTCNRADESIYGKFKCRLCRYSSGRRSTFTNHMAACHDLNSKGEPLPMSAFWCQDCDFTCASEPTLNNHVEELHPDRLAGFKPRYKCAKCDFNTAYRFVLDRHKRVHEPPGKSFACTLCGIKMPDKECYRRHMNRHRGHGTNKPAKKPQHAPNSHTCDICGYYNTIPSKVRRHRAVHDNVKPYPCPFCPARFSYKYNMGVHVENIHQKSRTDAYRLIDHFPDEGELAQDTTSGSNPETVATVCTLQSVPDNLTELLETNLEDSIAYGCSLCSFTFSVRAEAKFHCEIAHADKLPMTYQCGSCQVGAKYFSEMVRHLRKHFAQKSKVASKDHDDFNSEVKSMSLQKSAYCCTQCDLMFDSKKEYKRHKRSKHYTSGTLFKCSKCDYTSLDRSDVTRHLKESHDRRGKSSP